MKRLNKKLRKGITFKMGYIVLRKNAVQDKMPSKYLGTYMIFKIDKTNVTLG